MVSLIILSCLSLYSDLSYFSKYKETLGVIREIHYTDKHSESTPTNTRSRIVYEVDDVQYNGFISNWNPTFKEGKEVPIYYNIENPEQFNYIYQFNHLSFITIFLIILFVFCIVNPIEKLGSNRLLKGTYLYKGV